MFIVLAPILKVGFIVQNENTKQNYQTLSKDPRNSIDTQFHQAEKNL